MSESGGLLSSSGRRTQFRHFLEQQVQYFMPFYPSLGPHLKYPLRYLRTPSDDADLSDEERQMAEALVEFRADENRTPIGVAKHIDTISWNMVSESEDQRALIITGGAGSGKTIFSGVLFAHLCEMLDAEQGETLLLYSQLKDTRGRSLWDRVQEGINHPSIDKERLDYYDFKSLIEYEGLQRTILIIDSLDEVSGFEKDLKKVTEELMAKGIFPVWTCREDNWEKSQLDLVDTKVLARVKVPPLDTRPFPPGNKAEEWIVLAFSKVPLLYTFRTNFNLQSELRKELAGRLETKLRRIHSKLSKNEELINLDCREPFPIEVWDSLARKGEHIPILTDILCESMLEFIRKRRPTLSGEIESFLEKCASFMNREYLELNGEVNEKTPMKVSEEYAEQILERPTRAKNKFEDTIGLLKHIGFLSDRRGQLRFSHRAFAEYVLWKYSLADEQRTPASDDRRAQHHRRVAEMKGAGWHCAKCNCPVHQDATICADCGTGLGKPSSKVMKDPSFPNWRGDLTRNNQFILHYRKYLSPPYWEKEGIDEDTLRGLLNRTGVFLSAIPPLSKMTEMGSYGGHNLKEPWALSHQLWQVMGGSLGLETGEDKAAQEHTVSTEQVDALTADFNSLKPIQLQGFPGTGKTYSAVEYLLRKLTVTDVLDKRALVLTLNRELSRDIQRDLTFKHGKSKNILNDHQIGDVVSRIDALSLDEIFQSWAPDLGYSTHVIEDRHLRERFDRIGDTDAVLYKAAFTDFNHIMMDEWGDLIDRDEYKEGKSNLKKAVEKSPTGDPGKADEVIMKWYDEVRHLLNVRISNHKACMILANRIMRLESKEYMTDLSKDELLGKIDWTSGGGASNKQPSEIISWLKAELSENPELHFYNMALVDEVQDMPPQVIILASVMAKKRAHPHDLLFAGDHAQALKYDSFKWKTFFGNAKELAKAIIKLIPDDAKHSHHLRDLQKLHMKPDDIQELKENHRNPVRILSSMIDATWWNPKDVDEEVWIPTESVREIQKLRPQNYEQGTIIFKQSETMAEYEESLKSLLEYASKNARISIVICDAALEGFAESLSKTTSINTEVFQISTIKGLERPTVIVLGGWMVSAAGEHPYVFNKNKNFPEKTKKPKLTKGEIDRMNRRMLVALSRATETSVILVPPTGRIRDANDAFFDSHQSVFVQLPPPKIPREPETDDYASNKLEVLITPDEDLEVRQQRDYQTAFYGIMERIDFLNRAVDRPTLQDQLKFNRLRVERLIGQENTVIGKDVEGSKYLLTSFFQELDNVDDLNSSPLFLLLHLNRFSEELDNFPPKKDEDEQLSEWLEKRPKIPLLPEGALLSPHANLLTLISENPNASEEPKSLSELISYARLQNEINSSKWDLKPTQEYLNLKDYTPDEQAELRSTEVRIMAQLSSLLEQLTEGSSKKFEDVGDGIIRIAEERPFLPSSIQKSDKFSDDEFNAIQDFMLAFVGTEKNRVTNSEELIYNLTNVAIAVINNQINFSGKPSDQLSQPKFLKLFEDFMTEINSPYILRNAPASLVSRIREASLFARLPEFLHGAGHTSVSDTANLFMEYANLSGGAATHPLISGWPDLPPPLVRKIDLLIEGSIEVEGSPITSEIVKERQERETKKRVITSPEENLIRLVAKHPKKEEFLLSLIKEDDFLPSLSRLSGSRWSIDPVVELRATVIANIVKQFPEHIVSGRSLSNAFDDITEELLNSERWDFSGMVGWQFEHDDSNVPLATKLPMFIRLAGDSRVTQSEAGLDIQSSMFLTISLIRAGSELWGKTTQKTQFNTLLDYVGRAPKVPNKVAEQVAKDIKDRIERQIDNIVKISNPLGPLTKLSHQEISRLYYLWAACMNLLRTPRLASKSEKLLSDVSMKYPILPFLATDSRDRVREKFVASSPELIWSKLEFNNLQDYFVSSLSGHKDFHGSGNPKFTSSASQRSFWGRTNRSLKPIGMTNAQTYSVLRSLQMHKRGIKTPLDDDEHILSESEYDFFKNYIAIANIIHDELKALVQEGRTYTNATYGSRSLFGIIAQQLGPMQEMAANLEMSAGELHKHLCSGTLPHNIHLVPPLNKETRLSIPSNLSQRWGRSNQGFVIDILEGMGLGFDHNNRIHMDDVEVPLMREYIVQLEKEFGYSVQQKAGTKPVIHRGSLPKSETSEVLFHASRLSCEHFLEQDHIINSISQYIESHNQYMRERIKGCDVRRLPYDRISVSLIVPELSKIDPDDLEKYLQRLQKSTEKDLGRSIELQVEVYKTPHSQERSGQGRVYTAQQNAHGNIIVCGDSRARNSYQIMFSGTYEECLHYKLSR